MPINPPYRFDPLQNLVNVQWGGGILVGFEIASTINQATVPTGSYSPHPRPGPGVSGYWINICYMTDYSWELGFGGGGTSGTLIGGGTITEDFSYTYGSSTTEGDSVDPYVYFGIDALAGPIWGTKCRAPTAGPYLGYTDGTGGHPFFDALTVTADFFGWGCDGPWDDGVVQALSPNAAGVGGDVTIYGNVIATRTFDFSGVTATYKGVDYVPAALAGATASHITILLKKAP